MSCTKPKLPEKMKACFVTEYGTNFATLCKYAEDVIESPKVEQLKATEVVVEVAMAGLNAADVKLASGIISFVVPLKFPAVLGNDVCGKVVAMGKDVKKFKIGDEGVFLANGKFNTQIVFGARIMATHAQYVVLEEMLLTFKPAALPVEDAAACPTSITTAFQSLSKVVCKYDQESIVINGASGGVGSYLVLLAKHYFKYNHIIAVCSGKNADYVKSLGADRVIDYTTQGDYVTLLAQEKKQVIAVASTVGEYASHPQAILKSARQGGCFLAIAGPPYLEEGGIWNMVCFGCSSLVNKLWSLFNYPMYHFIMAEAAGEELDKLGKWMADNKMYGKIKLTKVSIKEAPIAYNQIRSKRTAGKLVFTINNNE